MDKIDSNRELWNEFTPIHERSEYYDLEGFLSGRNTLKSIELQLLGDIKNRSILHLQCHFGMDSLSLARLGARVTGVDISDRAIELARELNERTGLNARFIRSNIYELDTVLEERFDIVFTSYGILCWLNDLDGWAATIKNHLIEGGRFIIVEQHPLADIFDQTEDRMEVTYSYFDFAKTGLELKVDGSYASESEKIEPRISYEWQHSLEDIINALITSGLKLTRFREYPFSMYRKFPLMEPSEKDKGYWIFKELPEMPLLFSIEASL